MENYLLTIQTIIHYSLHLIAPGAIAWILFKPTWELGWIIMIATMLVDLDHLIAMPNFDPSRCSIGFHPLHSYYAIGFYLALLLIKKPYVRIVAIGLLFHMITDYQDCLWIGI